MGHQLCLIHAEDNAPAQYTVEVAIELRPSDKNLAIEFMVTSFSYPWNINDRFHTDSRKNWGLWEHDVVEVFWQNRTFPDEINHPYLEWQIAPNNKHFFLEISRPRLVYATPLKYPITCNSRFIGKNQWLAEFFIPTDLYAHFPYHHLGLFAFLGPKNSRQFFALQGQPTLKPNFHRPENFLPLSTLS